MCRKVGVFYDHCGHIYDDDPGIKYVYGRPDPREIAGTSLKHIEGLDAVWESCGKEGTQKCAKQRPLPPKNECILYPKITLKEKWRVCKRCRYRHVHRHLQEGPTWTDCDICEVLCEEVEGLRDVYYLGRQGKNRGQSSRGSTQETEYMTPSSRSNSWENRIPRDHHRRASRHDQARASYARTSERHTGTFYDYGEYSDEQRATRSQQAYYPDYRDRNSKGSQGYGRQRFEERGHSAYRVREDWDVEYQEAKVKRSGTAAWVDEVNKSIFITPGATRQRTAHRKPHKPRAASPERDHRTVPRESAQSRREQGARSQPKVISLKNVSGRPSVVRSSRRQ